MNPALPGQKSRAGIERSGGIKTKNGLKRFFKLLYLKLFRINDTPQKIAAGLGLGVFSGIFPGTGPIAALFLAFVFRVNRAASLIGSLLTNTWLSFVTFILSIKTGSAILGLSWQEIYNEWNSLLKGFHWQGLFKSSVLKIILPVALGYLIIALSAGLLTYLFIRHFPFDPRPTTMVGHSVWLTVTVSDLGVPTTPFCHSTTGFPSAGSHFPVSWCCPPAHNKERA